MLRIKTICKPQQKSFLSLVQWFGTDKVLANKFCVDNYNTGYRLLPYGKETYGLYQVSNYCVYDFIGNLNTNCEQSAADFGVPLGVVKFNKMEYERIKDIYNKFWEWRTTRNARRLAMEEEFNFDGKHAMHLVRLLRMGAEALQTGELLVKRPDAEELLAIRNGAWTYEELVDYAEKTDKWVRNVLYTQTNLPKSPNYKLAAKIIMDVQDMVWSR
jgi:hypothetical protein